MIHGGSISQGPRHERSTARVYAYAARFPVYVTPGSTVKTPLKPASISSSEICVSIAMMRNRSPLPSRNFSPSLQLGTRGHEHGRVVRFTVVQFEQQHAPASSKRGAKSGRPVDFQGGALPDRILAEPPLT
jgi:hypothetical protein